MTFRRFSSSAVFFLAALFCAATFALPAWAQERGNLASRGGFYSRDTNRLSLSLLRNQVSGARAPGAYAPRVSQLKSPPRVRLASRRVIVEPSPALDLQPPGPIALGAYFYQNGQCAPGDEGAVSAWRARAGRMPAVWMIFQGWTGWNEFPIAQARRAAQLGGQLMVTWEPWTGSSKGAASWNCALVASGAQDDYIRKYARAVKESGVPVMIRFAHEMNGDWYPWGTAFKTNFRRHNDNTPTNYVAMWRRVVQIFRSEGASNAQWVWAPNIEYLNRFNSGRDQKTDLAALYPGDDYVDWIGLSVYNDASKRSWRTFNDLFETTYQTLTAISQRPLMIAEMGVTEAGAPSGTSKAAWISQTLTRDIPIRYPRVKLVNWFCRDKTPTGEANYRFDSSPGALQAFRVAINSPLYGARLTSN